MMEDWNEACGTHVWQPYEYTVKSTFNETYFTCFDKCLVCGCLSVAREIAMNRNYMIWHVIDSVKMQGYKIV